MIYRDVGTSPPRELWASRAKLDFEIEMAGQPRISLDRLMVNSDGQYARLCPANPL